MVNSIHRVTRDEFLETMETNWGNYIPTLEALTDEEQKVFAQQQGFDNLRDFLAHLCGWWRALMEIVPILRRGEPLEREWTHAEVDAFNMETVGEYRNQTLEQVKEDFENLYSGVSGMIAELPNEAFNDPKLYQWLYESVIEHYEQHTPPGDPQVPAEQYGGEVY